MIDITQAIQTEEKLISVQKQLEEERLRRELAESNLNFL
jgi:hypothetical protein